MGKIKNGDLVLHHAVAEKDVEKLYPRINMIMIKVNKVKDLTFEDEEGKLYKNRRVSHLWRKGIEQMIKNDLYDGKQNFKEDLEALIK